MLTILTILSDTTEVIWSKQILVHRITKHGFNEQHQYVHKLHEKPHTSIAPGERQWDEAIL